jgi:hypothetical protein
MLEWKARLLTLLVALAVSAGDLLGSFVENWNW